MTVDCPIKLVPVKCYGKCPFFVKGLCGFPYAAETVDNPERNLERDLFLSILAKTKPFEFWGDAWLKVRRN